ncbi:MAG: SPFH domain-containing protein [Bacteroidales bacterium]|nr:SPFH domain-containing protein [Bacteroidales bacterium]
MNYLYILIPAVIIFLIRIRIVRPTQRGLIERLGKYHKLANPGFHWIIPVIDRIFMVNVTEQKVDAGPQEIITKNNLNASVNAQVYFRVKAENEKIVIPSGTELKNIIGDMAGNVPLERKDNKN